MCTSTTNSPLPPSACSQASISCAGGTVNEPPGREVVDRAVVDGGDAVRDGELHAARSIVASTAATPPAVWRNRRRSIPTARAASSARARALASISRSCCVGSSGTYSPFVAGVTPSGKRTSPSGSSSRRRGTRPTIRPATPRRVRSELDQPLDHNAGGTSEVRLHEASRQLVATVPPLGPPPTKGAPVRAGWCDRLTRDHGAAWNDRPILATTTRPSTSR